MEKPESKGLNATSHEIEIHASAGILPWQGLLVQSVHLPFPFTWLFAALILILAGGFIVMFVEHDPPLLIMVVTAALLIAAEANAVLLLHRMFVHSLLPSIRTTLALRGAELRKWELEQIRSVFSSPTNLGLGLVLAIAVVSVSFAGGMVFRTTAGRVLHGVLFFLIGFAGGSLLDVILALGRASHHLGKSGIMKVSAFHARTSGVKAVSRFMLQLCLILILVYLLGICLIPFIRHEQGPIQLGVPAGFGLFLVIYFVASQWSTHRCIRDAKLEKIETLVPTMEESFDAASKDPSPENLSRLRELFELQRNIYARPSWGFGVQEVLILLGSIVVPIIICVLQLLITRG